MWQAFRHVKGPIDLSHALIASCLPICNKQCWIKPVRFISTNINPSAGLSSRIPLKSRKRNRYPLEDNSAHLSQASTLDCNKSLPRGPTVSPLTDCTGNLENAYNLQVAKAGWQLSRAECASQSGNKCIWGPSAGSSMYPGEKNSIVLDWHKRKKALSTG